MKTTKLQKALLKNADELEEVTPSSPTPRDALEQHLKKLPQHFHDALRGYHNQTGELPDEVRVTPKTGEARFTFHPRSFEQFMGMDSREDLDAKQQADLQEHFRNAGIPVRRWQWSITKGPEEMRGLELKKLHAYISPPTPTTRAPKRTASQVWEDKMSKLTDKKLQEHFEHFDRQVNPTNYHPAGSVWDHPTRDPEILRRHALTEKVLNARKGSFAGKVAHKKKALEEKYGKRD